MTAIDTAADARGFYAHLGVELRATSEKWVAVRCFIPGHQDRKASAQVDTETGGFTCFACSSKGGALQAAMCRGYNRDDAVELVKRYGLWLGKTKATSKRSAPAKRVADTFDWGETAPVAVQPVDWAQVAAQDATAKKTKLRREWEYVDEHRQPLFRCVREDSGTGGKRIWQERYENGKWIAKLGETRRVIYRLPEVLERAARGETIALVEGEKTVDALDRIGVFATTSPAGAGKWRPEYADAFTGATVALFPDCDTPGRRHMAEAAHSLLAAGATVLKPVELDRNRNDGHDIADHLAQTAAAVREHEPGIEKEELRQRLGGAVNAMIKSREPASHADITAWSERFEFFANPAGREWIFCPRCDRERPHQVRMRALFYCPCGNLSR